VVRAIHAIEQESKAGQWNVRLSALCGWCEYKPLCPAFKHAMTVQALPENEYFKDSGVQLVQHYAALESQKSDLQAQIKQVELEQKKVEEAALRQAEEQNVVSFDGPQHRLHIKVEDEWKVPRKMEDPLAWELLRTTLKNAGKLEDVSTVNANMLRFAMKRGKWPEPLVKSLTSLITQGIKKTVSLIKK